MAEKAEFIPSSVLVVVAHPDDAEFMVAGSAAKWSRLGSDVTYVVVTKGDKGSDDPEMTPQRLTAIRENEQRAAATILGVRNCVFMGYPDAYLQHSLELRRDLTRVIRQHRPQIVVTFDPQTRFMFDAYPNHPDHRTTGDATIDAIFPSARDRLTFPELLMEGLEPHKVAEIWLGGSEQPNVWVDIGETLQLKREAMLAHPSQLGPEIAEFAAFMGRESARGQAFEYAESFRRIVLDQPPVPPPAAK
jgi:LmbE family N-acetylglucosaminyl deacetylase